MADPRFFNSKGPFTVDALAALVCADIGGAARRESIVEDVAALSDASAVHLSFFDNAKYKDDFMASAAGVCIVSAKMAEFAPDGMTLLISDTPYKSYALIAQHFYPIDNDVLSQTIIHPSAVVDDSAEIGAGCHIKAGAVIEDGVKLGRSVCVEPNAVIAQNVEIGDQSVIGANASISHALIGANVRIYPGVRIGQDGFGFAIDPAGHVKVPQLGRVIIGDSVEIGANTTIDRGAGPDTHIGQGSWIDNLVQIGHNVKIGRGCVIIAQTGVAGSTVLEDYAVLAAQVGVAGHLTIGMGARIGAQSGVMRDVAAGSEVMGAPAMPAKQFMRQVAMLRKMSNKN
jgi:UDP-3-O-[3-hydroxymyristoyl] glucosamine N-acyltransferase